MTIKDAAQWWKNLVAKANSNGVPIPMVRYKGEGNPALTLVFVSGALLAGGILHLGNIDIASAMQFFAASSTLFFGHSWVHKDSKGNVDKMDDGDNQN